MDCLRCRSGGRKSNVDFYGKLFIKITGESVSLYFQIIINSKGARIRAHISRKRTNKLYEKRNRKDNTK